MLLSHLFAPPAKYKNIFPEGVIFQLRARKMKKRGLPGWVSLLCIYADCN